MCQTSGDQIRKPLKRRLTEEDSHLHFNPPQPDHALFRLPFGRYAETAAQFLEQIEGNKPLEGRTIQRVPKQVFSARRAHWEEVKNQLSNKLVAADSTLKGLSWLNKVRVQAAQMFDDLGPEEKKKYTEMAAQVQ